MATNADELLICNRDTPVGKPVRLTMLERGRAILRT